MHNRQLLPPPTGNPGALQHNVQFAASPYNPSDNERTGYDQPQAGDKMRSNELQPHWPEFNRPASHDFAMAAAIGQEAGGVGQPATLPVNSQPIKAGIHLDEVTLDDTKY